MTPDDELRKLGARDLGLLDDLDARASSLAIDAHKEGDKQTVWYCAQQKKENQKLREKIKARLAALPAPTTTTNQ